MVIANVIFPNRSNKVDTCQYKWKKKLDSFARVRMVTNKIWNYFRRQKLSDGLFGHRKREVYHKMKYQYQISIIATQHKFDNLTNHVLNIEYCIFVCSIDFETYLQLIGFNSWVLTEINLILLKEVVTSLT